VKRYKDLISASNKARVTVYPSAFATKKTGAEGLSFRSLPDLARWLRRKPPKIREKRAVPLFSRGLCRGPRKKANLEPPFLVVLDVDKSPVSLKECSARLRTMGVDHAGHTTYSHGAKSGVHSYRVFTDHAAPSWEALEQITTQLFRLAALEPTRESWASPCFFAPAVHPDRKALYRYEESFTGGSTWRARRLPKEKPEKSSSTGPPEDVDVDELRGALEKVSNADYHQWVRVGQALHSSGLEEALELWLEWSAGQGYPDFDAGLCEEKWGTFSEGGGVGPGTIYHLARKGGWTPERATPQEDFGDSASPRLRALRTFNEEYAYVAIGQGMIAHLRSLEHPVVFMSTRAFLGLHLHPRFKTGDKKKDGTPVRDSIGNLWFGWKQRRSYSGRDFLPPGSGEELPEGVLNLWRGWRYDPGPGSCERYLAHVREVVCSGDETLYEWVLAWMAHMVQRPWEKPGTAIVLRSGEGTGKGVFANALIELCGVHGIHVTHPGQLTRSFNSHLEGKLLVFADEVTWGGRRLEEGTLKNMVTEKKGTFEKKGVDATPGRDFCRLVISSNNQWVVPASATARRWQVLDVSGEKVGDREGWFRPIVEELEGGGYGALMRHLRSLDLADLPDPSEIIKTGALRDQKLESLDSIDQWLRVVLDAGRLSDFEEGWPGGFTSKVSVYESYQRVAQDVGISRRSVEMDVMGRLKKVFGDLREGRRRVEGDRARVIRLPPLEEARGAFEEHVGAELEWGEP